MSQVHITFIKDCKIKNFGDVLDYHAKNTPDKIFIKDLVINTEITFSEFNILVNKTVNYLSQKGIVNGDIVSFILENSWPYLTFYFACIKSGVVVNPFPVNLDPQDLKRYLNYVKPKLIAVNSSVFQKMSGYVFSCPIVEVKESKWYDILDNYPVLIPSNKSNPDDPACLYYSSGTTANPKGILVSHWNMLTNISSIVDHFKFNAEDNHLIFLPLGHTASINYSMLPCLYAGATLTLTRSIWSIRNKFWEIISNKNITYLEMVPTALFIILNLPKPKKELDISSLKWIGCGSSQLMENQQIEFQKKFGVLVGNLYGLSETGPSHYDYPLEKDWKPGSIGFPLSVNECKIIDEKGRICAMGECGEIVLKGENIFIGYYKNDQGYKQAVKNGYFHTGDLGYQGHDGKFYFSGRKKDLIIKGGVNILPAEIEEILSEHPDVGEVAVIGIPDQIVGEDICAVLQLKRHIDEDALFSFCSNKLSAYKIPKKLIIVNALPKGPSGKILKRVLKDKYSKRIRA
jgi:acyl-CoA synthetase (AMP-forming)/AMP-acid ligase II